MFLTLHPEVETQKPVLKGFLCRSTVTEEKCFSYQQWLYFSPACSSMSQSQHLKDEPYELAVPSYMTGRPHQKSNTDERNSCLEFTWDRGCCQGSGPNMGQNHGGYVGRILGDFYSCHKKNTTYFFIIMNKINFNLILLNWIQKYIQHIYCIYLLICSPDIQFWAGS